MTAGTRNIERLVPVSSIAALTTEINRLSRTSMRARRRPIVLVDTGVRRGDMALVRIESDAAELGRWEIVAVLHHEQDATRVEACAPLPHSQLERLLDARALCEHCRTVRPRTQTWLLRERGSGRTLQVGSSCLRPLTGAQSIEGALRHARSLAAASARLLAAAQPDPERCEPLPGDRYIDATEIFLAHVTAVIRTHGWRPASDPEPTWHTALQRMNAGDKLEPRDLHRGREVRAWASGRGAQGNEYRGRLEECLGNDRLSTRELALAASGVRTYNRGLYHEIRRGKSAGESSARPSGRANEGFISE